MYFPCSCLHPPLELEHLAKFITFIEDNESVKNFHVSRKCSTSSLFLQMFLFFSVLQLLLLCILVHLYLCVGHGWASGGFH